MFDGHKNREPFDRLAANNNRKSLSCRLGGFAQQARDMLGAATQPTCLGVAQIDNAADGEPVEPFIFLNPSTGSERTDE